MTDERAALAARHHHHDPAVDWCDFDLQDWPCDTARALALPPDAGPLRRSMKFAWDAHLAATRFEQEEGVEMFDPSAIPDALTDIIIAAWDPKP